MATAPRIDRLEKNLIINGNFDFWQRATSALVTNPGVNTGYKSADRWFNWTGALNHNITFSRQTGELAQYCMRVQRNSGVSVTGNAQLAYTCEIADARMFAGKTVTLQFRARKGANYSPVNSVLESNISTGTGSTDSNLIMAGFTSISTALVNHTLTTSFQTFSRTFTAPANMTQLGISFRMDTTGTAGAADYFEIEQVMITIGDVKEDFCRAGRNYQEELMLCQRYYEKSYEPDTAPGTNTSVGLVNANQRPVSAPVNFFGGIQYKVIKRASPTVTFYNKVGTSGTVTTYDQINTNVLAGTITVDGSGAGGFAGANHTASVGSNHHVIYHYTADAEI